VTGEKEPGAAGVAVLGAGPAGLTAAWVLARRGTPAVVFEADGDVGGIAKTVEFNGYRFDLGGHRFFTKLKPVERLWEEMLGPDFLTRQRMSRIYYHGSFFSYPLQARDVLKGLGIVESVRCIASYLGGQMRLLRGEPRTFEEWVAGKFGKRLYDIFFRTYTEKVWGVPGSQIGAEWAAQRIRNFSLGMAMRDALGLRRAHVTTLIEEFRYPRLGPGQMWHEFARKLDERGIAVRLNRRCVSIKHDGGRVERIVIGTNGDRSEHEVGSVLSTIPLQELVRVLDPQPPAPVVEAAERLKYRGLCLVAIVTDEPEPFPDNWIYLHDPDTEAGRVQNFGAWSEDMVVPGTTCLGVEYFCDEGDPIWEMSSDEAVKFAVAELAGIGLLNPNHVLDGVKIRVPGAYPVYDEHYQENVATIRGYLATLTNLQTCGRNGLHRYNNQDHSMWTAILAALNLVDGDTHDVWAVNVDAEYHEEGELVDELLAAELAADPG
jgi:protoporphyrinogen oxidase